MQHYSCIISLFLSPKCTLTNVHNYKKKLFIWTIVIKHIYPHTKVAIVVYKGAATFATHRVDLYHIIAEAFSKQLK